MKELILFGLSIISGLACLQAQSGFSQTLREIENNNTSLIALRQMAEAGKISSHTGVYLQNPEIGFNYLWGTPGEMDATSSVRLVYFPQGMNMLLGFEYDEDVGDGNYVEIRDREGNVLWSATTFLNP